MQFGLLGFACDEGVRRNQGRPGAADAPRVFREILNKTHLSSYKDFGDVACLDTDLEAAQKKLGLRVFEMLSQGYQPVIIGGGHETAYGHFLGISQFLKDKNCGIINFDAHFDLRPLLQNHRGSSGTPFLQIALERQTKKLDFDYLVIGIQPFSNSQALFEQAQHWGVSYVLAENLEREAPAHIARMLNQHEFIYLSICLDVFAEACAPGVSAPQAFGLFPQAILPLIKQIKHSQKQLSCDIAELAPSYDRQNTTAQLAVHLMGILIEGYRPRSQTPL